MSLLRHKFEGSPELARVAPFGVYAVLGVFQGSMGSGAMYLVYMVKTLLAAWVIWEVRPFIKEMRWAISWEAVVVGIGIFAIWVGADGLYPRLSDPGKGATPFETFGAGSAVAWSYIAVHIVGMTVIVPPVEEVFYRSFLYRYFVKIDFLSMPLNQYHGLSFFVTSALFGLMHPDRWVAGIICGLSYQWLVLRKNRLGDAMTAHGITNCLLGLWIVWKGAWSFW